MGRRGMLAAVVAAVAALGLLVGCDLAFVEPATVDTGFGDAGVLTIEQPSSTLGASTTEDGGLLVMDNATRMMQHYLADGSVDPAWTPPTFPNQVQYFRGVPDGGVAVVTSEGGQYVLLRYSSTGARVDASTQALTGGPFFSFGMSPNGRLAVGSRVCTADAGCNAVALSTFSASGALEWSTTVATDQTGLGCSSSYLVTWVQAYNDGGARVAQGRCSAAAGTTVQSTLVRRLTPTGEIDGNYGAGEGYGVLVADAVRVVFNPGGEVLAMTGSYGLKRLTAAGVPDTTFGTRSGFTYTGGSGISALVPNGSGYTLTKSPTGPACAADGLTTVYFVDATGALASSFETPVAVGGANVQRYRNGDMIVSGVMQGSVVNGGSTSCVSPRTYRYLKVTAPTD